MNVCNRHYPETCPEYLEIGKRTYFFIHGHQYDKGQIPAFVLRLTGMRWDPLNWFQVLFNISFTKKYWIINSLIFLALVFGGWKYLWDSVLKSNFGYTLIWAVLTGFFALSSIPAIFTKSQRKIYNLRKPKDKTAQQIIEDKYYKEQKDTVVADVIVFGHTHFASSHEGKKKLFINSGCWVKEKDCIIDGKPRYTNTFVYIDESGAYILKWNDGKIDCIEAFPISKG